MSGINYAFPKDHQMFGVDFDKRYKMQVSLEKLLDLLDKLTNNKTHEMHISRSSLMYAHKMFLKIYGRHYCKLNYLSLASED